MTPHRDRNRGTPILDRQFRGVGRLKRASGTSDPQLFRLLDAMLTTLYKQGRIDILQALAVGALTPLQVWDRYRLGEIDRLPSADTMLPLDPAVWEWIRTKKCSTHHRAGLTYAFRALLRGAKKNATVADLPALLRNLRRKTDTPRMFNRIRSAAQAYISEHIGQSHWLYGQVREIKSLEVDRQEGRPLTVARARELVAQMGDAGPMLWSMAITGMGPGEYWGRWNVLADRVHIKGTKREGRVRDVPYVGPVVTPTMPYPRFRRALLLASTGLPTAVAASKSPLAVRVYDLRRTFTNWMEAAGIVRTRRKLYLGHKAGDVTDLYERHEVAGFLVEDGAKLRHYLGVGDPPRMRLVGTSQ